MTPTANNNMPLNFAATATTTPCRENGNRRRRHESHHRSLKTPPIRRNRSQSLLFLYLLLINAVLSAVVSIVVAGDSGDDAVGLEEPDCEWQTDEESEFKRLYCRVNSFNNRLQSLPQIESAESLWLDCLPSILNNLPLYRQAADIDGSGSVLRPNQFRQLTHLRRLTLLASGCRPPYVLAGAFGGLHTLQVLRIIGPQGGPGSLTSDSGDLSDSLQWSDVGLSTDGSATDIQGYYHDRPADMGVGVESRHVGPHVDNRRPSDEDAEISPFGTSSQAHSRLSLQTNSLVELASLQELDLTGNRLNRLPDRVLCPVAGTLRSLNLSHNSVDQLSDRLGFSGEPNCQLLQLEDLDLSHNLLTSILPRDLVDLPSLRRLSLRSNRLTAVSDPALAGLWSLSHLDLSHNRLVSLPSRLFTETPGLQKLFLQNNSLSLVAEDQLAGLDSLLLLNLSHNHLTEDSLTGAALKHQRKLVALDLGHNRMTRLKSDLVSSLHSLQILYLQNNQLETIDDNCFDSLRNLHILTLSDNLLDRLPADLFSETVSLSSLYLDHNRLVNLPHSLFQTSLNLHDLALNNNLLEQVPETLANLQNLRTLDLGENRIASITASGSSDQSPLGRLPALYGLRLAGNRLTTLEAGDLSSVDSTASGNRTGGEAGVGGNLHVLNLAHNRLKRIDPEALKRLQNLRALRLDNNRLADLNGLVAGLKNLKWLNVSTNAIEWFDFAFIPRSLEWLDIHNNRIDKIGNYYQIGGNFSLQTFDASFNSIKEIKKHTFLHSLRHIYLNNNHLTSVQEMSFSELVNLTRVEMQSNRLNTIPIEALAVSSSDPSTEFLLGGNPWICDCELEWLKDINRLAVMGVLANNTSRTELTYARVIDLEAVMCSTLLPEEQPRVGGGSRHSNATTTAKGGANSAVLATADHRTAGLRRHHHALTQLDREQFMCEYSAHCIADCFCCDFFACDCRMQCPDGCSCYHDNSWSHNIVVCSDRGHVDVPPLIPMDATAVYLDGNNMTNLANPGFIGRRRIRSVYLNNSNIRTVTNFSFEGLTEVRVLHLEDNKIERLEGNEFLGLDNLKELYLHNNHLMWVEDNTFASLESLTVLRLDGNQLTSFPVWQLTSNQMLVGLHLAGNLWSCNCDFVNQFLVFQWKAGSKIVDRSGLRCVSDPIQHAVLGEVINGGQNQQQVGGDVSSVAKIMSSTSSAVPLHMSSIDCPSGADHNLKTVIDGESISLADVKLTHTAHGDNESTVLGDGVVGVDYVPILVAVLLAVVIIVVGYLIAFTCRARVKRWLYTKSSTRSDDSNGPGSGVVSEMNLGIAPSYLHHHGHHHMDLKSSMYDGSDQQSNASVGKLTTSVSPLALKDKLLFDMFISYAPEDSVFVETTFAASLEHGPNASYRLCMHQRDFPPTNPITDSVNVALETSSRTIVVLSRAYLANQWPEIASCFLKTEDLSSSKSDSSSCNGGIKGRPHASDDTMSSSVLAEWRHKLVFVQLEEIPAAELAVHPDCQRLLHECPVIRWGEPQFWARLRCHLPEPVYLTFHRNVTLRGATGGTLPMLAAAAQKKSVLGKNGTTNGSFSSTTSSTMNNNLLLSQNRGGYIGRNSSTGTRSLAAQNIRASAGHQPYEPVMMDAIGKEKDGSKRKSLKQVVVGGSGGNAAWTYFVEDSHSSLDTNTTEMSDTSHDSSSRSPTNTVSTTVAAGNGHHMPGGSSRALSAASDPMEHTYYSIDSSQGPQQLSGQGGHIYHTLDPCGGTTPLGGQQHPAILLSNAAQQQHQQQQLLLHHQQQANFFNQPAGTASTSSASTSLASSTNSTPLHQPVLMPGGGRLYINRNLDVVESDDYYQQQQQQMAVTRIDPANGDYCLVPVTTSTAASNAVAGGRNSGQPAPHQLFSITPTPSFTLLGAGAGNGGVGGSAVINNAGKKKRGFLPRNGKNVSGAEYAV